MNKYKRKEGCTLLRKHSLLITLLFVFLCTSLFLGGCNSAQKPLSEDPMVPTPAPNANTETVPNNNDAERARQVSTEAGQIKGVEKANVLITGNNIYIGLDVQDNMDRNKSDTIEKEVTDKVKASQSGYSVIVTSDPDLVTRITNVANGIAEGKPLSSFGEEMELIGNRLNPQKK